MGESIFSKDFLWGAASAAAQVEGGWNEGGRTPSIWDVAPSKRIRHGENCHDSCRHFHHWKEDIALMKQIGLKSYRFSISWSRVIPEEGKINEDGLRFYSDLVDGLLAAGIEPLVTMFHWDMPLWVYKKGGWMSERIVPLFGDFTRAVVEALSDRVQWWISMNEPGCFIMNGYLQGAHAPFRRDYLALSRLTRNCMLAHALAVKTIRQYAKRKPRVGIALSTGAYVPENETDAEVEKARRLSMEEGCYEQPLVDGSHAGWKACPGIWNIRIQTKRYGRDSSTAGFRRAEYLHIPQLCGMGNGQVPTSPRNCP